MEHRPIALVQPSRALAWLGDGWAGWIVVGILAGIVVRLMTSSERAFGMLAACLRGIAGAALGGYSARHFQVALPGPGMRFLAAFAGSLTLSLVATGLARMLQRTHR